MKYFYTFILAIISTTALASPCTDIDRTLTEERKAVLAPIIANQVAQQLQNVESVEVLQSFHYRDWYIINVNTHVSDEGFLIYKGDPTKNNYLTILAGAYTRDDERFILKSIQRGKTKGIPKALARCIAWHLTKDPNQ
jgi:hypothetical protein